MTTCWTLRPRFPCAGPVCHQISPAWWSFSALSKHPIATAGRISSMAAGCLNGRRSSEGDKRMPFAPHHPSRRRLIAGGATLAAGALLPPQAAAPVAALASDRDFLDLLFVLEQSQIVRYQALLAQFDEETFIAAGLPAGTRDRVEAILAAD